MVSLRKARHQIAMEENILRRRSERLRLLNLRKNKEKKTDVNYDDLIEVIDDEKDLDYDCGSESKNKHTSGKRKGTKRRILNADTTTTTRSISLFGQAIHQEKEGRHSTNLESHGRREGKQIEISQEPRRTYKPPEDITSQFFSGRSSQLVPVTNEFSYKESLMNFAKAGGQVAEAIARSHYDQNLAMVLQRQQHQEEAMAFQQRQQQEVNAINMAILQQQQRQSPHLPMDSLMKKHQEQCMAAMFLFQQQQQQTNHRKILPKIPQWNPINLGLPTPHLGQNNLQPHASMLDLYNLNASLAFSSTDYTTGGVFGAPPSGSGSPTIAQNMGLPPLGVSPSSAGAQSLRRGFMGTSATTPNLRNMNTLPGPSVAHLLGQTPTPSFRPWNNSQ